MALDLIQLWHEKARQKPTDDDFRIQLACHLEEVVEMFDVLYVTKGDDMLFSDAAVTLNRLVMSLKRGRTEVAIANRQELLDSLCDQIVTAVGVGHTAGMQVVEGCRRVNDSNWSKFDVDGNPIRDNNGKILKGSRYQPPVLDGLF